MEPLDVLTVLLLLSGFGFGFVQSLRARDAERTIEMLLEDMPLRNCPFPTCGKPIDVDKFACRHCWAQLTKEDKEEVWKLYHQYQGRKITKAKLRELQAAVVAKYSKATTIPVAWAIAGVDRKQLERICLLFEVYLAKDDEYRKCKPQFEDEKKRLGREHKKLREAVDAMIQEVLHPDNGQRALFDNTAPPKGASNLPD